MVTKRKSGSPAPNQSRVEGSKARPKRVPVGGNRDILTVLGKDPEYIYRWVKDKDETGQRVFKFTQASYEFVDASTISQYGIGESFVYESHDTGSLIRKPAGGDEYLYLMRISREFFEEDQAAKEAEIRGNEESITRVRDPNSPMDDGQYGSVKLS